MKKIMVVLFLVALVSCKPIQQISNTVSSIDTTSNKLTEKIYETITRDSVVIRDSVIIHPDGSITKSHFEKTKNTENKNFYWYIHEIKTIKYSIIKTLQVNVPVEKKLTWLQSAEIWIGKIILLIGAGAALFFGAKYLLKLRKIIP